MKQGITLLTLLCTLVFFSQCASVKTQKLIKQNEETVRVWFEEGWNKHKNDELVERCFDPEWQDGNPILADQVAGHEGIRELVKNYERGATETHFTITHLFANESQVAIRFEVVAIHSGTLFGVEPTGRQFTSTGIVLYDMKDGRIKTTWQELDLSGIISQLK